MDAPVAEHSRRAPEAAAAAARLPPSWRTLTPRLAWLAAAPCAGGGAHAAPPTPHALALLAGGALLAVGQPGGVHFRSARSGHLLATTGKAHLGEVSLLAVDPSDDTTLYTAAPSCERILAWDMHDVEACFGSGRSAEEAAAAAAAADEQGFAAPHAAPQVLSPCGALRHGLRPLRALAAAPDGALLHGVGGGGGGGGGDMALCAWSTSGGGARVRHERQRVPEWHAWSCGALAVVPAAGGAADAPATVVFCTPAALRWRRGLALAPAADAGAAAPRLLGSDEHGAWALASWRHASPPAWMAAAAAERPTASSHPDTVLAARADVRALFRAAFLADDEDDGPMGLSHPDTVLSSRADARALFLAAPPAYDRGDGAIIALRAPHRDDDGGSSASHASASASSAAASARSGRATRAMLRIPPAEASASSATAAPRVRRSARVTHMTLSADERVLFAAHADGRTAAWHVGLPAGGWSVHTHCRYPRAFRDAIRATLLCLYARAAGPPAAVGEMGCAVAALLAAALYPPHAVLEFGEEAAAEGRSSGGDAITAAAAACA
jgi:hypothetical protein